MTHIGGLAVGFAAVFTVLVPVTTRLSRRYPGRTRWTDWVLGILATVLWGIAVTTFCDAWWPAAPAFVDAAVSGIGVAPVVFMPDIVAALRHRRRPESAVPSTASVFESRRPPRAIEPVNFSPPVHRHFAEPSVRARYVIAAHRHGLIPAECVRGLAADLAPLLPDGAPAWAALAATDDTARMDGAVDAAAEEIGYVPSPEEERADAVERLVYIALCSTDPTVRLATVELLAPPVQAREPEMPEWDVRSRIESRRAAVVGALEVRYDDVLTPGVQRHFTDPTVQAGELIAGYRRGVVLSADLPQLAAEVVADLPGAGEAWTELAMASGTEPRSELLPILDRAADEIAYSRTDEQAEADLIEGAAYRVIVEGRVMDESTRLNHLERYDLHFDDYDFDYGFHHAPALEALRDARYICGDGYYEQIASVRADLATYLTSRYS